MGSSPMTPLVSGRLYYANRERFRYPGLHLWAFRRHWRILPLPRRKRRLRGGFTRFDRLVFRLTAQRWNRIAFSVLHEARRGHHGPALTDAQLYALLAQFDPTQRPAWKRIVPGMSGLRNPAP